MSPSKQDKLYLGKTSHLAIEDETNQGTYN